MDDLGRILFVANGLVYRARTELGKTPKPWPKETVRANKLLAQLQGMLADTWRSLDADTKAIAIHPSLRSAPADAVGGVGWTPGDKLGD